MGKGNNGFTIIEILVVTVIIGLISIGAAISYNASFKNSRDQQRKSNLQIIRNAIEQYKIDHNVYPDSLPNYFSQSRPLQYTDPVTGVVTVYLDQTPNRDPLFPTYYYWYKPYGWPTTINYELCAYLETGSTTTLGPYLCGPGINCNYCFNQNGGPL